LNPPQQLRLPLPDIDLAAIFRTAHQQLKPRSQVPEIHVQFFPFAGLSHTARLRSGELLIRISDIFTDAPAEVFNSLALILLARLYRRKVENTHHESYRVYVLRNDIQERALAARRKRGRALSATGPRGRHVDLDTVFDRLNQQYFGGALSKPQLSWSRKRTRHILGRYDSGHHVIFISRLFDALDVPIYVVEYIMFHEMLHIKHRSRIRDARHIIHPPEFKIEERTFKNYLQAKEWLTTL
jgi:hypothetical protein